MTLFIIDLVISLGLSAFFGYLMGVYLGVWYGLIAILFPIPTYYLLLLLYMMVLFLFTFILQKKKSPEGPSRFFYSFLKENIVFLHMSIHVKTIYRGEELLPKNEKYVIISNHRSNFDQMIMIAAMKDKDMVYISKPGNFKLPIAGGLIKASGFIAINREDPKEGIKSINEAVSLIKEGKVSIGISPEGTRNKTDSVLLPFHPGTFQIAFKSNCPLVIASLNGTSQIHKRIPFRRSKVTFTILKTLYPKDYAGMTTRELAKLSEDLIKEELNKEGLIL